VPAPFPGSSLCDPNSLLPVPQDFLGAALSRAELIHPYIHAGSLGSLYIVQFGSAWFWFWFWFWIRLSLLRPQTPHQGGGCPGGGRGIWGTLPQSRRQTARRLVGRSVGLVGLVGRAVGRVQSLRVPPCVYVIWH